MKQEFFASVHRENDWFIAQSLGVDVASQGATVEESLENLKEALALHFEMPAAIAAPQVHVIEVEIVAD